MAATSIQLQSDVEKSLNSAAEELQRSKDWLVNQAVRDFLKKKSIENSQTGKSASILEFSKVDREVDEATVKLWLED